MVSVDPGLGRSVRRLIADREPARRRRADIWWTRPRLRPGRRGGIRCRLADRDVPAGRAGDPQPGPGSSRRLQAPPVRPWRRLLRRPAPRQSTSQSRSSSRPVAAAPGNRLVNLPGASGSSAAAAVPAPIGRFYSSHEEVRDLLGEAQPGSRTVTLLEQSFQGGLAIWRSDTREIYVLRRDGNTWSAHADTWQPGDPISVDAPPPPGAMVPAGGFGTVWRTTPEVQKRLGWAVYEPRGSGGSIQTFERGMVVWTPHGLIYVLTNDGRWRTYADATPM